MTFMQALVMGSMIVAAVIGFAAGWLCALDRGDRREVEALVVRGRHAQRWPRLPDTTTGELAQLYVSGYPAWEGQSFQAFMQEMKP